MKKRYYLTLCLVLFCMLSLLTGCKQEVDELDKLNQIDPTPTIYAVKAPEKSQAITPEITREPIEAVETEPIETIAQEMSKDIDNNGVADLARIMERVDGSEYVQVLFNGDNIFQYEWNDLRLICFDTFEYLDLDGDTENEIFITIYPNVNSRELIEVLTLKQSDGQWHMLDLPLNELGHNGFLFNITRGKDEFDFILSSEYIDEQIHFDASSFYEEGPETNPNSIKAFRDNHYKEGDQVAFISAWGISKARIGTYDGQNCIIAEHGIEGPYGNGLGRVIIYYDYDEKGLLEILNIYYVL